MNQRRRNNEDFDNLEYQEDEHNNENETNLEEANLMQVRPERASGNKRVKSIETLMINESQDAVLDTP